MSRITPLVRPNIAALTPYSTARDEYDGPIGIFLDANESPYENGYNRYPDPHQAALKARLCEVKGYSAENLFLGNGSDEAIDLVFRIFCEPGKDNAAIMTNLINLYIQMKEDPKKIVELLDDAKRQMPDNPSLYYVEGNILMGVKEYDDALTAYRKAAEIDPNYEWGYYGEGALWYQKAVDAQTVANDLPYNAYKEYDEKMEELSQCLKNAIAPFEACYEKAADQNVKNAAADNLKRIYFALRNDGAEYQAGYEKYNALVE